jgi:hypothetical protein
MARPRKNVAAKDGSSTARAKPKLKRARKGAPPECRPSQRTSAYRGVTRHRWTGRFEAHLWDRDTWNREPQAKKKKGKQGLLRSRLSPTFLDELYQYATDLSAVPCSALGGALPLSASGLAPRACSLPR